MTTDDRRSRETAEAASWWIRSRIQAGRPLSRAERDQLTEWLRESPLHISEMLHMARVQDTLERFKLWGDIEVNASPDSGNVVPFRVERESAKDDKPRARFWRRPLGVLAAASVAAAMLVAVVVPRLLDDTLVTRHAERREVKLSDGSIVQLDPDTRLRVILGTHERALTLESGRALFHVAKDPTRPFLVNSNGAVVRAVGTVFGVEQRQRGVVVTVSEGRVMVLPPRQQHRDPAIASADTKRAIASPGSKTIDPGQRVADAVAPPDPGAAAAEAGNASGVFVSAGEQLLIGSSGDADAVRSVDAKQALSWADGYLVFVSTPLSDVVDEFNHYNHVQLRLGGDDLSRRPISGTFLASDPETLIAFIQAGAHVSVTRADRGNTVLIASQQP